MANNPFVLPKIQTADRKINQIQDNIEQQVNKALLALRQNIITTINNTRTTSVNYALSDSSGFYNTSGVNVPITNMSATLTTTGNPVILQLVPDGTLAGSIPGAPGSWLFSSSSTGVGFEFRRDGTPISDVFRFISGYTTPSEILFFDNTASAATHIYELFIILNSGVVQVNQCKFLAQEI